MLTFLLSQSKPTRPKAIPPKKAEDKYPEDAPPPLSFITNVTIQPAKDVNGMLKVVFDDLTSHVDLCSGICEREEPDEMKSLDLEELSIVITMRLRLRFCSLPDVLEYS